MGVVLYLFFIVQFIGSVSVKGIINRTMNGEFHEAIATYLNTKFLIQVIQKKFL